MVKRVRRRKMTLPGRYECIAQAARCCAEAARDAGLDDHTVFHVEIAVDEACTNIIRHAYGGEDVGMIEVACRTQGEDFVVTLHDHGQPFDPQAVLPPQISADLDQASIGGLGLYFMRKLMDEVRFEFDPVKGNTVTMIKHANRYNQAEESVAGHT